MDKDGPQCHTSNMNRDNGFVWVCIRIEKREGLSSRWYIQGVADNEGIAIEMCADETYFIAPIPINLSLPHDRIEWIGAYFPLMEK